jgi:predicted GNAT superfamily acetyltransferase
MALLALALLASAILVTELNNKAVQYSRASPHSEAQKIAQKVAYDLDYVTSQNKTSLAVDFSPDLDQTYNITVEQGIVVVKFDKGSSSFPTLYRGSRLDFNTSGGRVFEYSGGDVSVRS